MSVLLRWSTTHVFELFVIASAMRVFIPPLLVYPCLAGLGNLGENRS